MTTMNKAISALAATVILLASFAPVALANDWYGSSGGCYTVNRQDGGKLFTYAGQIEAGDEYISGDNKRYRVVSVDDSAKTAVAQYVENVVLWEGFNESMLEASTAQQGQKKIGLYNSHTDESFIPGDGSEAKPEHGGIIDVANTLAQQLSQRGIQAVADNTPHDPHDAGAYRRSRSSAMNLMESLQPNLLLDIHRDGVPDPGEYNDTLKDTQVSRCRFVVGRSNQNRPANENLAKKLKQIADSTYPGLVKDIFIGHGSYNQDITPNALLIEIGTHTVDKARVIESTGFIADVLVKYLNTGSQNAAGASAGPQVQQQGQMSPSTNRAAGTSIVWIIGVVGGACLIFLLIATVSGQRRERVGNFFREVTGVGRHRDKDK